MSTTLCFSEAELRAALVNVRPCYVDEARIHAAATAAFEYLARAEKAESEVARLRAALVEIRSLPCDCDCPLDGGQHFHDCVTGSTAVDIARCALAGEEQTEHYVCPECGVTKATEYGECKFCGRDITIEPKEE